MKNSFGSTNIRLFFDMDSLLSVLVSASRFLLCVLCYLTSSFCFAQDRAPLQVSNQNPFVRIYGLPVAESAKILESGQETSHISVDWSTNFTKALNPSELIYIDGESAQIDIRWRYGFDLWEFGLDINFSRYSGGSLDSFIENWHDWFNLPNGERETTARNQLRFDYFRDGVQQLSYTENHSGWGDTRLTGGYQINTDSRFDMAIRAGIKLPTGSSDKLLGSEGVDFNIGYILADDLSLQPYRASYYLGGGVLLTQDGDILSEYRENTVYYYNAGLIKDVGERWQLKLQLDGHTEFYQSGLDQLGDALQFSMGGSYQLSPDLKLDFAVVEDIVPDSSSDVSFHFNLYNYF